jgi:aldose 1-epimerase
MTPPSGHTTGRAGQLFEIKKGDRAVVVTEQGGNLHQARWAGADLLDTVNDDGYTSGGSHGAVLMPWPGRVNQGAYRWEGENYQLPINDFAKQSAIHGITRWLTWVVNEHLADSITLSCRVLAMPGYPFPLHIDQRYRLRDNDLEIMVTATNIGARTAPFGYAAHPYFTTGAPTVNDSLLQVGAARYFETDEQLGLKVPPSPVDGTHFDFRAPTPIGDIELDVTLTDLARDAEGQAFANFRSPDGGTSITCQYDETIKYLQVFSGDTLPSHRRHGLAIEPCSCAPNAFNNGLGLIHLAPGASTTLRWAISAE